MFQELHEIGQPLHSPHLVGQERRRPNVKVGGESLLYLRQGLCLLRLLALAGCAEAIPADYAIDDEVAHRDALFPQGAKEALTLKDGHLLRNGHYHELGGFGVLQRPLHRGHVSLLLIQEAVALVGDVAAGEGAHHVAVLVHHHVQGLDPVPHLRRQLQHAHRVAGRGGVHHHQVVLPRLDQLDDLPDGHHLVHPRQGQLHEIGDVLFVEQGPPVGDLGQYMIVKAPVFS